LGEDLTKDDVLPAYFQVFIGDFDNLPYFIVGRFLVVMHFEEYAIFDKLIALPLDSAWHQATKNSSLTIRLQRIFT
jgi:hypothetical protein